VQSGLPIDDESLKAYCIAGNEAGFQEGQEFTERKKERPEEQEQFCLEIARAYNPENWEMFSGSRSYGQARHHCPEFGAGRDVSISILSGRFKNTHQESRHARSCSI